MSVNHKHKEYMKKTTLWHIITKLLKTSNQEKVIAREVAQVLRAPPSKKGLGVQFK
jgi:hypothetical protein